MSLNCALPATPARQPWSTVTVVIAGEERDEFMRLLSHAEAVRFAASDEGVSDRALELGAEPGDWDVAE